MGDSHLCSPVQPLVEVVQLPVHLGVGAAGEDCQGPEHLSVTLAAACKVMTHLATLLRCGGTSTPSLPLWWMLRIRTPVTVAAVVSTITVA